MRRLYEAHRERNFRYGPRGLIGSRRSVAVLCQAPQPDLSIQRHTIDFAKIAPSRRLLMDYAAAIRDAFRSKSTLQVARNIASRTACPSRTLGPRS